MKKSILILTACILPFLCHSQFLFDQSRSIFYQSQSFDYIVYRITHPIPYNYDNSAHSLKLEALKDSNLISSINTVTYKYLPNFSEIDSISRNELILSFEKIKYDKKGNVISFQGKQDYKTYNNEFSYDSKNRLIEVKNRYSEIVETFKYSSKLVKRFFHPNSFSFVSATNTKYKLNRNGQIIQKKGDGGVPEDITYSYNANGDVISENDNDTGEETKVTYKYDEKSRVINKKLINQFDSRIRSKSSEYFYDTNGNLIRQTDDNGKYETLYYYEENYLVREVYTRFSIKEFEIQYQYDIHGNWVKKIVKFGDEDPRPDSISIREIIYK